MNRLLPFLMCLTLLWSCGSSEDLAETTQSSGEFSAARFAEGNKLMNEKSWDRAIAVFEEMHNRNPENANLNYKLGLCYLNTATQKADALPFLKKATSGKSAKQYDPFNPLEDKAPIDAHYFLGRAEHINYEMDNAIGDYQTYMDKSNKKHHLYAKAQRQIEMCNEAIKQVSEPKNFRVSNLGSNINSEFNDFSPIISLDENVIFFTSRRIRPDSSNVFLIDPTTGEYKEDIYVSYKGRQGDWSEPEVLNVNKDEHTATVSVAPDGQTLFIYYDNEGNGELYKSILIGETWSEPELLGSNINTKYWETHATMTADENTIYFTSNRKGGSGGRDIYRVVTLPNGELSKALNLGPTINTPYEEESPFISPDGNTMYFASEGHESMGGFDIFFTQMGADGEWSQPENIGYPLNTVDDDVFFVPSADGQRAYYASMKGDGGTNLGLKDIYMIDIPENRIASDLTVLKGFMIPEEGTALPENLNVIVTDLKSGNSTSYTPRQRDGAFVVILPPCENYRIEYLAEGNVVKTEEMKVPCESSYREIEREVLLTPVVINGENVPTDTTVDTVVDTTVEMSNDESITSFWDPKQGIAKFERFFLYDYNTFGESEERYRDFIENIIKVIDMKGEVEVAIEASASYVPSSKFKNNDELSAARAETAVKKVKRSLTKRGIDMSKVSFADNVSAVNGPKYKNDAQSNKATYERFQYIKAIAK